MRNGLTKLPKEMHPVMVGKCLCSRQITDLILIEREHSGNTLTLLRTTIVSVLRKLANHGYVEVEPNIDTSHAIYYKVLPKYTQEMEAIQKEVKTVFITASMALIGRQWVNYV